MSNWEPKDLNQVSEDVKDSNPGVFPGRTPKGDHLTDMEDPAYRKLYRRYLREANADLKKTGLKPSKYHNQRTEYGGRIYASKKEADFARGLDLRIKAGEIKGWIPQVMFPLPGGTQHRVDFEVFEASFNHFQDRSQFSAVSFWEVKGRDLPMGKMKRKQTEELYGIRINIV